MAWPGTLPKPLLAGYGFQEDLPILRTQMEQGPDRVLRISDTYVTTVSLSVILTPAQLAIFRAYIEGEANMGADWFDMPITTTQGSADHQVRILSVSTQHLGTAFQVNMQVETEEHIAS